MLNWMEQMAEVYIIKLYNAELYLRDIKDCLSLTFIDNPLDAIYFTKELAEETVRFLQANTDHSLIEMQLNDQEDVSDNLL